MSFHEIRFPDKLAYGSRGGPGYATEVLTLDSGREVRVQRWAEPRSQYDASYGLKSLADLGELITFYHARAGAAHGFRFKDFNDFTSASDHIGTPAADDVTIEASSASGQTEYQLKKTYINGGVTQTKTITKPVTGTVVLAVNGTPTTSFTVDTTTGIITAGAAPTAGSTITAGYEYDVPVRFGESLDEALAISRDSNELGSLDSIPLIEIKEEVAHAGSFNYGGAAQVTANYSATLAGGRVLYCTGGALTVSLPNPASGLSSYPLGGPYFYVINGHASGAVTVKEGVTTVATVAAGSAGIVLMKEEGGTYGWVVVGA